MTLFEFITLTADMPPNSDIEIHVYNHTGPKVGSIQLCILTPDDSPLGNDDGECEIRYVPVKTEYHDR